MNIGKSYWIVSLSVLLSLSLVLPYCCHADISELFSHHQEMSAHAIHVQHSASDPNPNTDGAQCDCGHEFVKDYQKTKNIANSQTLSFSPAVASQDRLLVFSSGDFISIPKIQPDILSNSGPPIHLLNGVFLN